MKRTPPLKIQNRVYSWVRKTNENPVSLPLTRQTWKMIKNTLHKDHVKYTAVENWTTRLEKVTLIFFDDPCRDVPSYSLHSLFLLISLSLPPPSLIKPGYTSSNRNWPPEDYSLQIYFDQKKKIQNDRSGMILLKTPISSDFGAFQAIEFASLLFYIN